MLATHLWIRLRRDRVIAPTPEARRLVARAFVACDVDRRLLAFGQADTHLHALAVCEPPAAKQLARRVEISLQARLRLRGGFAPVDWEGVEDVWHLRRSFTYVQDQCRHHGLTWDPLLESTSLHEHLGMRLAGDYMRGLLRAHLPRVTRAVLLQLIGIHELTPRSAPPEAVVEATLRATALPRLSGFGAEVTGARRAALELLGHHEAAERTARRLGISRASLHRLRKRPVDGALVRAIRLQAGLEWHVSEARVADRA